MGTLLRAAAIYCQPCRLCMLALTPRCCPCLRYFNAIQSECFREVAEAPINVVLAAPTGQPAMLPFIDRFPAKLRVVTVKHSMPSNKCTGDFCVHWSRVGLRLAAKSPGSQLTLIACAAGSGKTVILELAILQLLSRNIDAAGSYRHQPGRKET